jgi:cell division protease FtsH
LFQKEHHLLADALLEYETLSAEEIKTLINTGKFERKSKTESTPAAHVITIPAGKKNRQNKAKLVHINVD